MTNNGICSDCIHSEVCRKKDIYNQFVEAVYKVKINVNVTAFWFAKDYKDIKIDVDCAHRKSKIFTK